MLRESLFPLKLLPCEKCQLPPPVCVSKLNSVIASSQSSSSLGAGEQGRRLSPPPEFGIGNAEFGFEEGAFLIPKSEIRILNSSPAGVSVAGLL